MSAVFEGDFCGTDFVLGGGEDTSARELFFHPLIGLYDSFLVEISDFDLTPASCSFLGMVFFFLMGFGCLVWLRIG